MNKYTERVTKLPPLRAVLRRHRFVKQRGVIRNHDIDNIATITYGSKMALNTHYLAFSTTRSCASLSTPFVSTIK